MNKTDLKVKDYLHRAEEILEIRWPQDKHFEKVEDMSAMFNMIFEVAKMIQAEEARKEIFKKNVKG